MKHSTDITVLATALLFFGSFAASADAVNAVKQEDAKPAPQVTLAQCLSSAGIRLNCYFTLEGDAVAGDTLARQLVNDRKDKSIADLVADLEKQMPRVALTTDEHNPSIIHVRDRSLINNHAYIMDQRITARYSGPLQGLPSFLGKQTDGRITSLGRTTALIFFDYTTSANVDAHEKPVRDVLTQPIILSSYWPMLWESWVQEFNGHDQVVVHYFGAKGTSDAFTKAILSAKYKPMKRFSPAPTTEGNIPSSK